MATVLGVMAIVCFVASILVSAYNLIKNDYTHLPTSIGLLVVGWVLYIPAVLL